MADNFTIKIKNKPRKNTAKSHADKYLIVGYAIMGTFILFGLLIWYLPYTLAYIRCGQAPVQSSNFMANFTYKLPGDDGYSISPFGQYRYCTQAEIEATHTYHRGPVMP